MIVNMLLNIIVLFLGAIFSWLPQVLVLPTIAGFDIDTALQTGLGQLNFFMDTFWPLYILMQGFLVLVGYYVIKMTLRFFLGHRAPGGH